MKPKYTDDNKSFFERYGKDLQALYGNLENMTVENSYEDLTKKYQEAKVLSEAQNKFLKMNQHLTTFKKEHNNEDGNEDLIMNILGYDDKDREFYTRYQKSNLLPMDLSKFGGIFNDYLHYYGSKGNKAKGYYKETQSMAKDFYLTDVENKLLDVQTTQKQAFNNPDVQFTAEEILSNPIYTEYNKNKATSRFRNFNDYLEGTGKKQEFFSSLNGTAFQEATDKFTSFKKDRDRRYKEFNSKVDELTDSFYKQHALTPFDKETYARMKKELDSMRIKDKFQQSKFLGIDQNDNQVLFRDLDGNIQVRQYEQAKKDTNPDIRNLTIKQDEDGKYYRYEVTKKANGSWEINNTGLEASEAEFLKQQGIYQNNRNPIKFSGGKYQRNELGYVPSQLMTDYLNLLEDNYQNGYLDPAKMQRYVELDNIISKVYEVDTEGMRDKFREMYKNQPTQKQDGNKNERRTQYD